MHYTGPDRLEGPGGVAPPFRASVACIMLALVGIPLGIGTRKGGKSAGYVVGLFLGVLLLPPGFGVANRPGEAADTAGAVAIGFRTWSSGLAGLVFLARMERPGDRDLLSGAQAFFGGLFERLKSRKSRPGGAAAPGGRKTAAAAAACGYLHPVELPVLRGSAAGKLRINDADL